ncbi:MAG: LD-carboxypeptidase [Bacteroidetes bacterium]|nr:LD-carboxypeptidase [Bacteroidota bacterium]
MSIYPSFLQKGDKIALIAPARKITFNEILPFIKLAEKRGFEVVYTDKLFESNFQFAGDDDTRADDFQYWLNDNKIKALIAVRGGYGTARIIDKIDFSNFVKYPKWLIGFSDFTVVHSHVNTNFDIATLHATMPIALNKLNSKVINSFNKLFDFIEGNLVQYKLPKHKLNKTGNCKGKLCGGNLSVMISIMGSVSETSTDEKILFIEDLDEYLYHIDRMMQCLKRAGKFDKIKGMLVGGMNKMHNNKVKFGLNAYQIVKTYAQELDIPVYFGINAGHISANYPLIMGAEIQIVNNCLKFGN